MRGLELAALKFSIRGMGNLSLHPLVEEDLAQIHAYISGKADLETADEVYETIKGAFRRLLSNPFIGAEFITGIPKLEGLQRYMVKPFKRRYHVFFMRLSADEVRILYVYHHSRDVHSRMAEDVRE